MLFLNIEQATDWGQVWMVTILGFSVVFAILVIFVFVMKIFGAIMSKNQDAPAAPVASAAPAVSKPVSKPSASVKDNEMTAVALALHLYFNSLHDQLPPKMTIINKTTPWNDKLYGMNNLLQK